MAPPKPSTIKLPKKAPTTVAEQLSAVADGELTFAEAMGLTRTEATAGVIEWRAQTSGRTETEVEKQMAEGNVVQRIIDAADIGVVVAFLASPLSIAITGDAISAGGGAPRAIYY